MQKCPTPESGMAGKAEGCKGCPNANKCASAKPDTNVPLIKENLKSIKCILAVLSGKGGVGKSTISRNIATAISARGIKTVLLDFDLSGPSIPRLTKTEESVIAYENDTFSPILTKEGIGVISIGHLEHLDTQARIFDTNTKNYVIKKILKNCNFSNYELMVIDTPPNITEEHLALINYIKPNYSVMVTTPHTLSLNDVKRQVSFCNKTGISILGMIENMKDFYCPNCTHINTVFSDSGVKEYCKSENINYLGSIPLKTEIAKNSDLGLSFNNEIFEKIAIKLHENFV